MSGRSRPYHHGDLHRALLDATLALAEESGPAGVTLRQAAERAGVSPAAPYRHFADKDAMLAAASEEGFRILHERLLDIARGEDSADIRRMARWVVGYVQFAVDRTAHFRLMFGQGSPGKATTDALQGAARETFQLLLGAVEASQRAGGLRSGDPRQLALDIWSLGHGLAVLAIDGQSAFLGVPRERIAKVAESAAEALLSGLEPAGRSRERRPMSRPKRA